MEQNLINVDELSNKDSKVSAAAKLPNILEDVKISVKCDFNLGKSRVFDRKLDVSESSDLETELSRLPQVLDENHPDVHRYTNSDEKLIQGNRSSAPEHNKNYLCENKSVFESIKAVSFETAFMLNSLSRLSGEDNDFRIDPNPLCGSQKNLKCFGTDVFQAVTTSNKEVISEPINTEGHINSIKNKPSNPDEVINETETRVSTEDPVIQLLHFGVIDNEEEKGELGCGHHTKLLSNIDGDDGHADAEPAFRGSVEATAHHFECKLSSIIKVECQEEQWLKTETVDENICEAATEDNKFIDSSVGKDENAFIFSVILDQNNYDPDEMHIMSEKTETLFPVLCTTCAGAEALTESKHCTEGESPVDNETVAENKCVTDSESAVASKSATESRNDDESSSSTENEIIVEFRPQAQEKLQYMEKFEVKTVSKHDTDNDFQNKLIDENMAEEHETNGVFESKFNATTENAVSNDVSRGSKTEFDYYVKHTFETGKLEEIEHDIHDNLTATSIAMLEFDLREHVKTPEYEFKHKIIKMIEDEATDDNINEKSDEEKMETESEVMNDKVKDEGKSCIKVEHHPRSELDDKVDNEVEMENRERFETAGDNEIDNDSSNYVNLNANETDGKNNLDLSFPMSITEDKTDARNEPGSKTKTKTEMSENRIKEISNKMKTGHKSSLKNEACKELEVEMRSKFAIQLKDEVEGKLEIAELHASSHHAVVDKLPLEHDAENQMGKGISETSLIKDESRTGKLFQTINENYSQKNMSGNLCEIAKDVTYMEHETLGVKSSPTTGVCKETTDKEDKARHQVGNDPSVEIKHLVEDTLGGNDNPYLEPENKCGNQRKDVVKEFFGVSNHPHHGAEDKCDNQRKDVDKGIPGVNHQPFGPENECGNQRKDVVKELLGINNHPHHGAEDKCDNQRKDVDKDILGVNHRPFGPENECGNQRKDVVKDILGVNDHPGYGAEDKCDNQKKDVDKDILGVNHQPCYGPIGPENLCDNQRKDGFRQHATAEIKPETVAEGMLNEVFQTDSSVSDAGDETECIDLHDLTDVSLSEGLLKNQSKSCLPNLADTEPNFTLFGGSPHSAISADRNSFASFVDSSCSETAVTTSTRHHLAVRQTRLEVNGEQLNRGHQLMSPKFTESSKIPGAILESINLTRHDVHLKTCVKDVHFDQQKTSTKVQDCFQNPRSVETADMDFILSSTVEKSQSEKSVSFDCQAQIVKFDDASGSVDFAEPTSAFDDFESFSYESGGLIRTLDCHHEEVTVRNYLDDCLKSNAVNQNNCDSSVTVKATDEDSSRSNVCKSANQTDSVTLSSLVEKCQKNSTMRNAIVSTFTANQEEESSCVLRNASCPEYSVSSHTGNSLLLISSTMPTRSDNMANLDELCWLESNNAALNPNIEGAQQNAERCCSKASQKTTTTGQGPLNFKGLGVDDLDDTAVVPHFPTDSSVIYKGSSKEEFDAFGRDAVTSATKLDFEKQMITDRLEKMPQEVPSCYPRESEPHILTDNTSTMCNIAKDISGGYPSSEKEISPSVEHNVDMPSDEQLVPSVESMEREKRMPTVSCLPIHLEETLYEEPPVKRQCRDVSIGVNLCRDIDHKWHNDKQGDEPAGYKLTNMTGGLKERIPLYAWKNFDESVLEDHSGITEESYPINKDAAVVPVVIPQLNKCQKPLRLGLSRRHRVQTHLHPNFRTPTD